ncbi:MAG: hypothetical protein GY794_05070, partial [bacterium]|nr:hypothetical protein [bacterium]
MRIGIRAKMLALLVAVALLPLVAALVMISIGSRHLLTEQYGQTMSSTASVQAKALEVSLREDIKFYTEIQNNPEIVKVLSGLDQPPDPEEIKKIEATWSDPSIGTSGVLWEVLNNSISRRLRLVQKEYPLIAEILVTDRAGVLVAATQRTSDYYQADEDWWQGAWSEGRGCVYTPPVNYDRSAGLWSIDICIPIRDGKKVVGVGKVVLDVSAWVKMHTSGQTAISGATSIPSSVMLVRRSGEIFYPSGRGENENKGDSESPLRTVGQWHGEIARGQKAGWRFSDDGMLQGFAPLEMPDRIGINKVIMPSWSLIVYVPASEILKPAYDLSFNVLWIGLSIVVVIFVVGMFLAERGFARRIRWLGTAVKGISEENLSQRVHDGGGLWRLHTRDEIDELTDDFNAMLARVEKTHRML